MIWDVWVCKNPLLLIASFCDVHVDRLISLAKVVPLISGKTQTTLEINLGKSSATHVQGKS
eukprot:4802998-Amphidinium_carterae.1